jgi:hypothetical protein
LVFIFRRLKINHDTHEFILESGTVANNGNFPNFSTYHKMNTNMDMDTNLDMDMNMGIDMDMDMAPKWQWAWRTHTQTLIMYICY